MNTRAGVWQAIPSDNCSPQLHGWKAFRLSSMMLAGFPCPPGWILPVADAKRAEADHGFMDRISTELLGLHPDCRRWLLRSSSPLEDRPGSSAAGLFLSLACDPVPEDLCSTVRQVLDSARMPSLYSLLQLDEKTEIPLAILAQPLLDLEGWWTAEYRADPEQLHLEGWKRREDISWPSVQSWKLQDLSSGEPAGDGIASAARIILDICRWAGPQENWLLEAGNTPEGPVILQLRPAPMRAPEAIELLPETTEDDIVDAGPDLPRFPLHPADAREEWIRDAVHSPWPLCPLLAGIFATWLAAKPTEWPSRIIHGCWHDRETIAAADEDPSSLLQRLGQIEELLEEWTGPYLSRLQSHLQEMREAARSMPVDRDSWHRFLKIWLEFQDGYYSHHSSILRRWAAGILDLLALLDLPVPLPPLGNTVASQRSAELNDLAEQLAAICPLSSIPAAQLRAWVQAEAPRDLAEKIHDHLQRHGHIAPLPWDGRGVTLSEDPLPFWQDLNRRLSFLEPLGPSSPDGWPPLPLDPPLEKAARLATRILASCEDDDDLLAKAYAEFRQAARNLAHSLDMGLHADKEVFDLFPLDLEAILKDPDPRRWRQAFSRGRSTWLRWQAHWEEDPSSPGRQRKGLGVSPGRAQGRIRRLRSAMEEGGPEPGEILVVESIAPADAVIFPRLAGLVCESGSRLDHAAILARESGIPAVLGLAGARRWLASSREILLDGGSGEVIILS